jgi:hypothetical protein
MWPRLYDIRVLKPWLPPSRPPWACDRQNLLAAIFTALPKNLRTRDARLARGARDFVGTDFSSDFLEYSSRSQIRRAGTPATTQLSSTSPVTTEPAPTTTLLPIIAPGRIIARSPMNTLLPTTMGAITSMPGAPGRSTQTPPSWVTKWQSLALTRSPSRTSHGSDPKSTLIRRQPSPSTTPIARACQTGSTLRKPTRKAFRMTRQILLSNCTEKPPFDAKEQMEQLPPTASRVLAARTTLQAYFLLWYAAMRDAGSAN